MIMHMAHFRLFRRMVRENREKGKVVSCYMVMVVVYDTSTDSNDIKT